MIDLAVALAAGYETLAARADLLDRINVFPVADNDTGANLRVSLAPLRENGLDDGRLAERLAHAATGNSGNIAAAFFREFCRADVPEALAAAARRGAVKARCAVAVPRAGTMLDLFDRLASLLADPNYAKLRSPAPLLACLRQTVLATTDSLDDLRLAKVVDAGALGMYAFFDGFFRQLGPVEEAVSFVEQFRGRLSIDEAFHPLCPDSHCISALLAVGDGDEREIAEQVAGLGDSAVVLPAPGEIKLHLHSPDRALVRRRLGELGRIIDWEEERIAQMPRASEKNRRIHVMTDAAGSLSRVMAGEFGITLLDSYILTADGSRPESLCDPLEIYGRMRRGEKVSTAQASIFERHLHYRNACERFGHVLYLAAGSIYTGNYACAEKWRQEFDASGQFAVIDSGAASGRLALMAWLAARLAESGAAPREVVEEIGRAAARCEEYVFIDELRYLVAGGRLSRASGFFANLLHMKPVITPTASGVCKQGVVRSREGQVRFALARCKRRLALARLPFVLLQFSDNEPWLASFVAPRLSELLPEAEIRLVPLSLTSGVHMGPGAWSMAWYAEE